LWPSYDQDASGELDLDEASRFYRAIFTGNSPADFHRTFAMMDADGSGTINKTEMAHFMREHCS
jgi:hypothetical protein